MIDLLTSNKLLPQHSVVTQANPPIVEPSQVSQELAEQITEASKKLTPKQLRFADNYLVDLNGSRAYRDIYKFNGGSERTLASELLAKPLVKTYVNLRTEQALIPYQQRAERVLQELNHVAFANMLDFAEWNEEGVNLKKSGDLTREQGAAVLQVTQMRTRHGTSVNLKLHDKVEALTRLGNNLRLFEEDKLKDINIAVQVVNVR